MAPHAKGVKVVAWFKDHVILDRMDEHMQLRSAGIRRQDIVRMQSISQATYATDEQNILLMHQSILSQHAANWADTISIGITRMIARAEATLESPLASEPRKASALDSLLKGWAQIGKILETRGFNGYTPGYSKIWCAVFTSGIRSTAGMRSFLIPLEHPDSPFTDEVLRYFQTETLRLIFSNRVSARNITFDIRAARFWADRLGIDLDQLQPRIGATNTVNNAVKAA